MNRRVFLGSLLAPLISQSYVRLPAKITRLTFAPIQGRFHKFVAMNAYDKAPKGHTYENTLVRVFTSRGVEGIGVMGYSRPDEAFLQAAKALIGIDPLALYEMKGGRVVGRAAAYQDLLVKYMHLDGPLFDLIGKLTGKPAWKLIGESVRERVEAYDGSLYFSDIWFRDRGPRAVLEEAEEAVKSGYRGLKLKVGRGWKWMPKDTGLQRDIEVLTLVRRAVGPETKILADANDGFRGDFDRAWRLLEATKDVNLYWMEEIFPEHVEQYSRLKERMAASGIRTLIADGENFRDPTAFEPYLKPRRLIDVLQMDIRSGGFLGNLDVARRGRAVRAVCVPHNWGSQVGLLMGLHLAKAVESVVAAEDDRSTCDAIIAEGYEFRDGFYTVPDTPGLGIRINEEVYREKYKGAETVVA